MAKRFNNLQAALTFLRTPGAAEGAEIPDAPAGTVLKKFQDYKAGKVDLDYPRSTGSLPGETIIIAIKPFGLPAADTDAYKSSVSTRSSGEYATFGLSETVLGIDATPQAGDIDATGYVPAKAICRNITGTTASTKTSKLTGLPYKSKSNASYTFPVGRTSTNPSWSEQKAAILTAVNAATGNKSASFKSEKF
ncbi:hypothetical protein H6G54_12085 [Anabaena cylindrica FACHB-243]|uniref:Uncharacterized protein n=1 Tax=Anabaena cylindrica (strain ATCC 27899 / PCC 7122) TaxID=272123 RepID=K9ZE89_ANACC|nr:MULTISPECIES: hypothetical protein [Anabaena]AFZ56912.1 hypothetical protein Anacy_1401 [Anabaena cylindrica PCC 7122]MBD2418422.1 hypothetical protein [Anabaena cylindrica FACHB-243]MBY5284370.1 hypothetical protein [Anabaena sp. CCAP 1446/1C]MBY5307645.1 hypothetical protein [Anabaena sp. CCAP 1446/1C]MCM2409395.1 hypothetical protein [Anabaena sp. CCAP 1446/1C]